MGNVVFVLSDSRDDVAVHDLDVKDIEQQLHPRRADLLDDFNAIVGVVAGRPRAASPDEWFAILLFF